MVVAQPRKPQSASKAAPQPQLTPFSYTGNVVATVVVAASFITPRGLRRNHR